MGRPEEEFWENTTLKNITLIEMFTEKKIREYKAITGQTKTPHISNQPVKHLSSLKNISGIV